MLRKEGPQGDMLGTLDCYPGQGGRVDYQSLGRGQGKQVGSHPPWKRWQGMEDNLIMAGVGIHQLAGVGTRQLAGEGTRQLVGGDTRGRWGQVDEDD